MEKHAIKLSRSQRKVLQAFGVDCKGCRFYFDHSLRLVDNKTDEIRYEVAESGCWAPVDVPHVRQRGHEWTPSARATMEHGMPTKVIGDDAATRQELDLAVLFFKLFNGYVDKS
jgi:hypothetical protein